jgi:thioredoxin 1
MLSYCFSTIITIELFINIKNKNMALTITDANFAEITATEKPVLIDFWAEWCGPCKTIGPIIEAIGEERDDVVVGKVDVDTNAKLSLNYNIRSIPTVLVLYKGEVVAKKVGGTTKAAYEAMIEEALEKAKTEA